MITIVTKLETLLGNMGHLKFAAYFFQGSDNIFKSHRIAVKLSSVFVQVEISMRNPASAQEITLLNKLKTFELYGRCELQVPITMMAHLRILQRLGLLLAFHYS